MADTEESREDCSQTQATKIPAIESLVEKNLIESEKISKVVDSEPTLAAEKTSDPQIPMETDHVGNGNVEKTDEHIEHAKDNSETANNKSNNTVANNLNADEEAMDTSNTPVAEKVDSTPNEDHVECNMATAIEDKTQDHEVMETEGNGETICYKEQINANGTTPTIENGETLANKNSVPELEGEQLAEGSPTSKPTLSLTPKTKIKLNIIPKEDDDIVEVPVVKPKIDVIEVPDDEVGDTEVVSEDELPPPPSKEKVEGVEEVSDEELPAGPKPDTAPEGAEEVSDEELPAAPKPELPPEAEDVSDEELQEIKSKTDSAGSKAKPQGDVVTIVLDDSESKATDRKRSGDDCSFPSREDAKKPRSSSPDAKAKKLPELEQYWKSVKENPSDFTGWTYLLKYVDQESDVEAAEEAYSTFLAQYPYCYGYWRKYADYERKKGTQTKCEEVFDQGLKAIPLSVDLWIHFLNYVKSVYVEDPEYVRKQYERCVAVCGLEFRADALWDSYIKWEIAQKNFVLAVALFDRVLAIPLHGNTTHFDHFQTFVASQSPKDILPVEAFLSLRKEILSLKKADKEEDGGDDKPPGDEDYTPPGEELENTVIDPEEANAMREKIVLERRKMHKETAAAVAERRPFEEGIKRPYFHVKALEKCQLKNWKDYLDFEIKKGDEKRIEVLFERCLIACALYEEFWHKYICYLQERESPDIGKIRDLFHRACTVHHVKKVNLNFEWAAFEEINGNAEKAQDILENIEKGHPQLVEISMRRIALEKRRKLSDSACRLYEKYIELWSSEKERQNYLDVVVKYARYCTIVLRNVDKGVDVLKKALDLEKECHSLQDYTRLHLQLIDLELHRPEVDINQIVTYLDSMLERKGLTLEQKLQVVSRKLELLEEYGDNVVLINKTIEEFRLLAKQNKSAQESRKQALPSIPVVEKREIPTQIISAVRKSKPASDPPPTPMPAHPPPPPQPVFYPGPPSQPAPFMPQGQYPPPQQPPQYTPAGVPPPPPNFSGSYPMDPNAPMMYAPAPYPMYGGPPNPNFSGGSWPPGNYGPGNFPNMNTPPNQRRY